MTAKEIYGKMRWHLDQLQLLEKNLQEKGFRTKVASYTKTGAPLLLIEGGGDQISTERKTKKQ